MAGVTAGGAAHAEESDDIRPGYPAAGEAADDDPFGLQDDPGSDAASGFGADAGYGADPPEPAPEPPPAAPRRGRGQHAARHGKPSRRSRGEG
jgi:hypothetical protein